MNTDPVAIAYAQALLEAADGKDALDEIQEEAIVLSGVLESDDALRIFIENPRLERSVKREALEGALRGKVSDLLVNVILLLIDKGRQALLRDVLEAFRQLYDEKIGLLRAEAVSAVPLQEEVLESLRSQMSEQLGLQIEVENRVDPSILGGLVVRFDGMVADGSLMTSLNELRLTMSSLKFGSELIHED